ncbi:hypothetical protein P3T23_006861, partial [Paraburkholderia sp. GAS448]
MEGEIMSKVPEEEKKRDGTRADKLDNKTYLKEL